MGQGLQGVFIFILGLLIGSFLNVCIYRYIRQEQVTTGSSRCPHCETPLRAVDLVPLLSYLWLGGKCRFCWSSISPRYFIGELITGIIFYLAFTQIGWNPALIKFLTFFSILIVISGIDIEKGIIPNKLVMVLGGWVIVWQITFPDVYPGVTIWQALAGAFIGSGFLFFVALISKGKMGGGDIKLMLPAGFFLGPSMTALAIFLAALVGSVVGIGLMVFKIKGRKDPIPFGPFLSAGIFIASLWGNQLVAWYVLQIVA